MSDPFSIDPVNGANAEDDVTLDSQNGSGLSNFSQIGDAATDRVTEELVCQRCGKHVPVGPPRCRYCDARLPYGESPESRSAGHPLIGAETPHPLATENTHDYRSLTRLMVFYLILLATNIFAAAAGRAVDQTQPKDAVAEQHLQILLAVELVDAFIVLISLAMIPRPPKLGRIGWGRRLASWIASPVILAVLLGVNIAYHWLLNSYIQFPEWVNLPPEKITPLTIVAICIQPAIVEELFFRYLALGTLRRVMGMGAALCISSIMFGMAHSGAVLSIPILTVIGAGLAMARIWSGGLVLPMILHALHNGAVLYMESNT